MPKCLECGFEASRLQWTHFKYKCSGKFNNGKEYRKAHPGAMLVDSELAKKTAITLENLINKYGAVDGQARWDSYRGKQALSNSFEYKRQTHGWTEEEFNKFNKSRSATLDNMVERHGEIDGTLKWQEYCERQAYTNTKLYFVEKYGATKGTEKYKEICNLKANTVENVQRVYDCSVTEAIEILVQRSSRLSYTSKLEQELVQSIEEEIGTLDYSFKEIQYCVYGNNKANFYDVVHNKKAIEFNGDYWHCNPKMYSKDYLHPHGKMTAKEIWDNDKTKISLLESERNIKTLVVWEADYLANKEQTIKDCILWLQK